MPNGPHLFVVDNALSMQPCCDDMAHGIGKGYNLARISCLQVLQKEFLMC